MNESSDNLSQEERLQYLHSGKLALVINKDLLAELLNIPTKDAYDYITSVKYIIGGVAGYFDRNENTIHIMLPDIHSGIAAKEEYEWCKKEMDNYA